MHRLVHIVVGTLMLAGIAESAAAASWRLAQPAGETITLTVTNTVIHIVTRDRRIEIPVAQVQSLHVTTRYLDPFEKWESWQPEGHDRRAPSPALDAIADNGGEGVILLLGAIVVVLAFWVEFRFAPPFWVHAVLWPVVTVPLAVLLMRPAKAALVALQFRHRATEMGL